MSVTRKQILELVEYYKVELALEHWLLRVHFGPQPDDTERSMASSAATVEYLVGDLYFDLKAMHRSKEDVELIVRHEMVHLPIRRLYDVAMTFAGDNLDKQEAAKLANEQVTTHFERLPVWRYARKTRRRTDTIYPKSEQR